MRRFSVARGFQVVVATIAPDTILSVNSVRKTYGRVPALSKLDFDLRAGQVLALLGPNGAGKTTALELVTSLLRADAGVIEYRLGSGERDPGMAIGYAPEVPAVWPELTTREQCRFVERLYDRSGTVDADLSLFGLAKYADRRARMLSMGNQKKLNILLAGLHRPKLLVLDEPFNGLDAEGRSMLREWITTYVASSRGVLMASHQLDEVRRIADSAIVLCEGRMLGTFELSGTSGGDLEARYEELVGRENAG